MTGTKTGEVFGLDPDNHGALLYRVPGVPGAGPSATGGRGRGNIVWGGAVDNQNVYYGVGAMGLGALSPATGRSVWAS